MRQRAPNIRTVMTVVFSCIILVAALGCSNPTVGPSIVPSTTVGASGPLPTASSATFSVNRFGDRVPGVVYVTSQGLYYDTFATAESLPPQGKFQLLANGETEFGPGQPGYLGGRWWVDSNGNGIQDSGDTYFSCPLLPPGRPAP